MDNNDIIVQSSDTRHSIEISNPIQMNDIEVNNTKRKKFPRKGGKVPVLSSVRRVPRKKYTPPSVEDDVESVISSASSISSIEGTGVQQFNPSSETYNQQGRGGFGGMHDEASDSSESEGGAEGPLSSLDMLSNPTKKLNVPKGNDSDDSMSSASNNESFKGGNLSNTTTPMVGGSTGTGYPSNINTSMPSYHGPSTTFNPSQPMDEETYRKIQKEKQEYLYKLHRLEQKGIRSNKKLSMKSNFDDIKAEYENLVRTIDVESSIKFQRRVVMAMVSTLEFVNNRYDPFDLKLDGWSESVIDGVEEFDGTFERLHDKYKTKAQMAPEVELMMSLAGSAFMFHLTNSMFKSAMPNMSDILKQNPELMQNISSAMMKNSDQEQAVPNPVVHNMKGPSGGAGGGMADIMSNMMNNMRDPNEEAKMNHMNRGPRSVDSDDDFANSIGNFQNPRSSRFEDLGSVASSDSEPEVREMTIDNSKSGKKSVTLKL